MKYLIVLFLLAFSDNDQGFTRIAQINKHVEAGEKAYKQGNYKSAIVHYTYLADSLHYDNDNVLLNLAHAYLKNGNPNNAAVYYQRLTTSKNNVLRSLAYQHLGVIAFARKEHVMAADNFKNALKANPKNEQARYNYEIVRKTKPQDDNPEQPPQGQKQDQKQENKDPNNNQDKKSNKANKQQPNPADQQKPQDKPNQGNQNKDNKDKQGQDKQAGKDNTQNNNQTGQGQDKNKPGANAKDQQPSGGGGNKTGHTEENEKQDVGKEKAGGQAGTEKGNKTGETQNRNSPVNGKHLEKMNLSEEKAKMLLDAMRSSEIQYLQQRQHMSDKADEKNEKSNKKSKPDW